MQQGYYLNNLYPLQDRVLKEISDCNTPFYLTGGTALSRHYLNHRFSDDLDLFVNRENEFKQYVDLIIDRLKSKFAIETSLFWEDFVRLFVIDNHVELKIELVNDVAYHSGKTNTNTWFNMIDSWENILSNKLTAIQRNAAKDFADIIFLSLNFDFNWRNMFEEAKKKDTWVNELEVSTAFINLKIEELTSLNWTIDLKNYNLMKLSATIARDILIGEKNSLFIMK